MFWCLLILICLQLKMVLRPNGTFGVACSCPLNCHGIAWFYLTISQTLKSSLRDGHLLCSSVIHGPGRIISSSVYCQLCSDALVSFWKSYVLIDHTSLPGSLCHLQFSLEVRLTPDICALIILNDNPSKKFIAETFFSTQVPFNPAEQVSVSILH